MEIISSTQLFSVLSHTVKNLMVKIITEVTLRYIADRSTKITYSVILALVERLVFMLRRPLDEHHNLAARVRVGHEGKWISWGMPTPAGQRRAEGGHGERPTHATRGG